MRVFSIVTIIVMLSLRAACAGGAPLDSGGFDLPDPQS
jgi:hypothetical protein